MSNTYFIDGYNVMYQCNELRPIALRDLEEARETLIEKVAVFCVTTASRVSLVFDGRAKHLPEVAPNVHNAAGMEILYSPANVSADAVIERLIYRAPNRLETVVVSNDRGLRDLCRGMGALTMDANHFLRSINEVRRENMVTFLDRRRAATPAFLEDLLNDKNRAQLEAMKKRLQK